MHDLTNIIENINFVLIACVIKKHEYCARYTDPEHPYHLAMKFCMERLDKFLAEKNQREAKTHIIVEHRGAKENNDLSMAFRRVCAGDNFEKRALPFELVVANKWVNSSGLQIADLTARPIGGHVLRPEQFNRAFESLKRKLYCKGGRNSAGANYEGWGLKCVP